VLNLAGHSFSGTLPTSWAYLKQLKVLDASRNSLTGSLPIYYTSMQQLAILRVHSNQLARAADNAPEFYELLLGDDSKLQCICVDGNQQDLMSGAEAARLLLKAKQRAPPVPLALNEPDNSLCNTNSLLGTNS
jgi:hypothetical protein